MLLISTCFKVVFLLQPLPLPPALVRIRPPNSGWHAKVPVSVLRDKKEGEKIGIASINRQGAGVKEEMPLQQAFHKCLPGRLECRIMPLANISIHYKYTSTYIEQVCMYIYIYTYIPYVWNKSHLNYIL